MYWPLGTPRIYAAKLPATSTPPVYDSDDGSAELVRNSLSTSSGIDEEEEDFEKVKELPEDDDEAQDGQKVGEKEVVDQDMLEVPKRKGPGKRIDSRASSVSAGAEEGAEEGDIIALKIARNGFLFATITGSELTIWQMKVSSYLPGHFLWKDTFED